MENQRLRVVSKKIEKTLIELSIKKAPVDTLKECLTFRTKAKLFDLAGEHGEYVSKSNKKAEMIEQVKEILLKEIEKDSLYITNPERKAIAQIIKGEDINKIKIEETFNFKRLGYIYWFYDKDKIQIVCPDEIAEIFMRNYERDYKSQKKEDEVLKYTKALQNIYGIFDIQQLILVWNRYNEEKVDEDFICEIMNRVGSDQEYFWWSNPYIISDYFQDVKHYKEFAESRVEEDYYFPTKKEVEYYMKRDFDRENVYYKRIFSDFAKQGSLKEVELFNLMLAIEISCTLNKPFQDIIKGMKSAGLKFKNINELNKLIMSYIHLSNNTRKWYLKGFMPVELSGDKAKDNVIHMDAHKITDRKKIGRNEQCPCNSGKKYKFCCGR